MSKLPDEAGDCRKCAFFPGDDGIRGPKHIYCKWFYSLSLKCWTPVGCAMITDEVPE